MSGRKAKAARKVALAALAAPDLSPEALATWSNNTGNVPEASITAKQVRRALRLSSREALKNE